MKHFSLAQTDREELLDAGRGDLREVRKSLADIARINRFLGGARPVCDAVWQLVERQNLARATLVDIGTGNADIPRRLAREAQKRGFNLHIVALDLSARHLQIAREITPKNAKIDLAGANAFALPMREKSVDIVIASLFLHHFRAPQIEELLKEFGRVARAGWIINDIERAPLPLWFFRLTRPIFARSWITRYDGQASIRRAYTRREIENLAPYGASSKAHFPFRWTLTREFSSKKDVSSREDSD